MMSERIPLLVGIVVLSVFPFTAHSSPDRPEAVILLSESTADSQDVGLVADIVRSRVGEVYRVVDSSKVLGMIGLDESCAVDEAAVKRREIMNGIMEGLDLFYESTALHAATRALSATLDEYFDHTCVAVGDTDIRHAICAGAVVQVRLLLMQEMMEAAAVLARRMSLCFPARMVQSVDAPPDVRRFLDGVREGVESVGTSVEVVVSKGMGEVDDTLFVNGSPVPGTSPWVVELAAGTHEFTLVTSSGEVLTQRRTVSDEAATIRFDPGLAGAVKAGPSGTLVIRGGPEGTPPGVPVARLIADVTGVVVLLVLGKGEQGDGSWVVVREITASGSADAGMFRFRPGRGQDGSMEVVVDPSGTLSRKRAWPWPWVSAGLSVGFLAAGAYLNWAANDDADAVNRGENRVQSYKRNRTWAIVNYALAAAGVGTSLMLYFLQPGFKTHFTVGAAPIDDGVVVGLSGKF